MQTEKIKSEIIDLFVDKDPAIFDFDLSKCLDLYFKIINYKLKDQSTEDLRNLYSSMAKSLEEIFENSSITQELTDKLCKNYEGFIKKIYFILLENNKIKTDIQVEKSKHAVMVYLASLNKINKHSNDSNNEDINNPNLTVRVEKKQNTELSETTNAENHKRLYPNSLSFGKYKYFHEIEPKYINTKYEYLIKAYILKNEQSHENPLKSMKDRLMSTEFTIGASLIIIDFLNLDLSEILEENIRYTKNFMQYIENEKKRYANNSEKFVPLSFTQIDLLKEKIESGFVEEIILKTDCRLRILGEGGSGKTTTLQNLIYKDCINWIENRDSAKIPVLIILSNISANETIIHYISKKLTINTEYVEELMELNELTLYIDGLNEIAGNNSRSNKILEIKSILSRFPIINLIITDRYEFDSYQNNVFNLPTFIVEKLNTNQQIEFVNKYCATSDIHHSNVLQTLKNKTNIHDLLLKPLILARSIEIIRVENDLPELESEIIERFIDIMLRREKDEKNDTLLNINNFKNLLCKTANQIFKQYSSNRSIRETEFNQILVDSCNQLGIEQYYASHTLKLGFELEILLKNGDMVNFYHESYFNFFCSLYLDKFI
ncbi:MAG: hypothetical protein FJX80_02620 [Bacteroidetes bacterium]|nr:hypothetical protein [Bacteroidota bacterium]